MRTISILKGTKIWTTDGLIPVEQIGSGGRTVVSAYGVASQIQARRVEHEETIMCMLDEGNRLLFGKSHQFMARDLDSPVLKSIALADLIGKDRLIRIPMPSRKAFIPGDKEMKEMMLNAMDSYEDDEIPPQARSKIHLKFRDPGQMSVLSLAAGFFGMTSRLRMADSCIDIDERRPTCFASKLLIGTDTEELVNSLIDKAVLHPALPYDAFLAKALTTGMLCEGYGVADMRTVVAAASMGHRAETWHVTSDDPSTTIELAFIRT